MTVYARQAEGPATPLSPREREVLELIGAGATNREIAERLFLSPHTIKDHTTALYRKLGVRNRAEATRKAEQLGLTRDGASRSDPDSASGRCSRRSRTQHSHWSPGRPLNPQSVRRNSCSPAGGY
jgi:DNA-binding CsgD family transcriptional regulator